MEGSVQYNASAALSPEIGGCLGLRAGMDIFGEVKNLLLLPGFKPRTVQFVTQSLHPTAVLPLL
jgi:hypothetical protein